MKRLFQYLAAGLTAAIFCMPAEAGSGLIRLTDRDDLFGWEAIGRVEIGDRGYCTGVLIASNLVLTAGHCVYDRGNVPVAASDISFRAGLRDGTSVAERQVSRLVAHGNYTPGWGDRLTQIRFDAALLELSKPISTFEAAPFAIHKTAAKGDSVSVVSYGRGRDDALSWQRECNVLGRGQSLMVFDCNVTFGSSGAPVFIKEHGRARILTLVSSGTSADGQSIAFGMELPQVVSDLKRQLRAAPRAVPKNSAVRRNSANTALFPKRGISTGAHPGPKFARPKSTGGS